MDFGSGNEHRMIVMRRFGELAGRARENGIYTYSTFHSIETASTAYKVAGENEVTLWGGTENCERVVARFGDPKELLYEEDFPIRILCIRPKQEKFADKLTHRDFLGAVLSLGIERDMLGDIIVSDNSAFIFVLDRLADIVCSELTSVKHTAVRCTSVDEVPEDVLPKLSEENITVSSPRLDAVLSKIYHLSRGDAKALFEEEKVTVNGRLCRNPETILREDSKVSARGYGKFEYRGEEYTTRKGKTGITIWRYV